MFGLFKSPDAAALKRKQQQIHLEKQQKQIEKYLQGYLNLKEFDNTMNKECYKKCLDYKFIAISDNEKICLYNCNEKQKKFVNKQIERQREEEGNLFQTINEIKKNEGAIDLMVKIIKGDKK